MGHSVNETITMGRLNRIQEVLNRGEFTDKLNWKTELEYIKKGKGQPIPVNIKCDMFIENETDNVKYAFEFDKMPSDSFQIRASKEKMFKLLSMNPPQVDFAFYALPYDTSEILLTKWFDVQEDECMLIGDDFWNLIGEEGIYDEIMNEINPFGEGVKRRICEEHLGIENG